jgi:hypothetical protein
LPAGLQWFLLAAFGLIAQPAAAVQRTSPADILANHFDLVRSGQVWINRTEERLLRRLDALPTLRRRIVDSEKALSEQVEQNRAAWNELIAARQFLERLEASREKTRNGAARQSLDRQHRQQREVVRRLQQRAVNPEQLGGIPAVRSRLITLSNDRNALLLSVLWIRSTASGLDETYRQLRASPLVTQALRELGGDQQLGPLRDYAARLSQLAPYEKLVFRSDLPLYLSDGRLRVSLIVGEQTPATFTWQESHEPTLITATLAEAGGIEVPPAGPRERVAVGGGQSVEARRTVIPYLRLGRHVVQDVPAFLLPPNYEHIGSQIGAMDLKGLDAVAEPALLQLSIRPEGDR